MYQRHPNNKERLSVCLCVCPVPISSKPLDRIWWNFACVSDTPWQCQKREKKFSFSRKKNFQKFFGFSPKNFRIFNKHFSDFHQKFSGEKSSTKNSSRISPKNFNFAIFSDFCRSFNFGDSSVNFKKLEKVNILTKSREYEGITLKSERSELSAAGLA